MFNTKHVVDMRAKSQRQQDEERTRHPGLCNGCNTRVGLDSRVVDGQGKFEELQEAYHARPRNFRGLCAYVDLHDG